MSNSLNSYPTKSEDQEINLKQVFEQYAFYWKWFILSVLICFTSALIYLRYADKIYNITAKILLQDENKVSGELVGLSELANLTGSSPASAFVLDQIDVMKSRRIFSKVVQENRLNIVYKSIGNVKSSEMPENQSPLRLILLETNNLKLDSVEYSITVKKKGDAYVIEDEQNNLLNYSLGEKFS